MAGPSRKLAAMSTWTCRGIHDALVKKDVAGVEPDGHKEHDDDLREPCLD